MKAFERLLNSNRFYRLPFWMQNMLIRMFGAGIFTTELIKELANKLNIGERLYDALIDDSKDSERKNAQFD